MCSLGGKIQSQVQGQISKLSRIVGARGPPWEVAGASREGTAFATVATDLSVEETDFWSWGTGSPHATMGGRVKATGAQFEARPSDSWHRT